MVHSGLRRGGGGLGWPCGARAWRPLVDKSALLPPVRAFGLASKDAAAGARAHGLMACCCSPLALGRHAAWSDYRGLQPTHGCWPQKPWSTAPSPDSPEVAAHVCAAAQYLRDSRFSRRSSDSTRSSGRSPPRGPKRTVGVCRSVHRTSSSSQVNTAHFWAGLPAVPALTQEPAPTGPACSP